MASRQPPGRPARRPHANALDARGPAHAVQDQDFLFVSLAACVTPAPPLARLRHAVALNRADTVPARPHRPQAGRRLPALIPLLGLSPHLLPVVRARAAPSANTPSPRRAPS